MPNYKQVLHNGKIPDEMLIHHINKNPSDNRIENLQMVTKSERAQLHIDKTKLNETIKKLLLKNSEDNQNSFLCQNEKIIQKEKLLIGIISPPNFAQDTVISEFKNYLERQKLSVRTVQIYMNYHERLARFMADKKFNQGSVDLFLDKINSSPVRAYLKQLLSFFKNKEIEIPKMRGRKPRKMPNILGVEEKEKIASVLYNWRLMYGLMFELTDECALRRGEIVGICLSDFDWEDWKYEQTSPCRLKIKGKGGKERKVVVSSKLMQGLVVYLNKVKQEEDKTFFKIKYARWDKVFRKACLQAIGKTYKLHEIRHTRATMWYNEGKDIVQIKNRLGHASISTTQLYINPDEEQEIVKWEEELRKGELT